ncbi:MAG: pyridoxal phosphate-dependent aminotransferase family protein, partial [Bacteroidales bacterium]|nr:pyridoxal phosphate-dependent aminotransferase family protein [Bacteroidales bacterium]
CVTPIFLPGNEVQAAWIARDLRTNYKIFCSIVTYPVIPRGMIIFRIIPTAAHSLEDVHYTLNAFKEIKEKLAAGEYDNPEMPQMAIL